MAQHPGTWQARPNVHLAYHNAAPPQRLYLHCPLDTADYIRRWSGDDFAQVRAHPPGRIREDLWPWLRERQYAAPEDDQQLGAFLQRLGRRNAHLRPSIELQRTWPWAQAVDLDDRGVLASEVRTAIADLLGALDEPLPLACNREDRHQRPASTR